MPGPCLLFTSVYIEYFLWGGEMTQLLKILTALVEDPSLVPMSGLLRHLHREVQEVLCRQGISAHVPTQTHTHMPIIKKNKLSL